jgi:hypothetical protein
MPYGFQIGKYTATIEMIGDADLTFKKYIYIYQYTTSTSDAQLYLGNRQSVCSNSYCKKELTS